MEGAIAQVIAHSKRLNEHTVREAAGSHDRDETGAFICATIGRRSSQRRHINATGHIDRKFRDVNTVGRLEDRRTFGAADSAAELVHDDIERGVNRGGRRCSVFMSGDRVVTLRTSGSRGPERDRQRSERKGSNSESHEMPPLQKWEKT